LFHPSRSPEMLESIPYGLSIRTADTTTTSYLVT